MNWFIKKNNSNVTLNSGDFSILYHYKDYLNNAALKNLLNYLKHFSANISIPSYLLMNEAEIQSIYDYTMPIFKSLPKQYRPDLHDFEKSFKERIKKAPVNFDNDVKSIKNSYSLNKAKRNGHFFSIIKFYFYIKNKINGK